MGGSAVRAIPSTLRESRIGARAHRDGEVTDPLACTETGDVEDGVPYGGITLPFRERGNLTYTRYPGAFLNRAAL